MIVLVREDRRRDEHGGLLAFLQALEDRAGRDFRLAVANVAAQQAVHGGRSLHVLLDLLGGTQLICGLLVRECVLELFLPRGIGTERESGGHLALRGQLQEILGHIADGGLRPGFRLLPVTARQAVDLRRRRLAAHVLLDGIHLVHRHVQHVFARVADLQVVALAAVYRQLLDTGEPADPVRLVHDIVAFFDVREGLYFPSLGLFAARLGFCMDKDVCFA